MATKSQRGFNHGTVRYVPMTFTVLPPVRVWCQFFSPIFKSTRPTFVLPEAWSWWLQGSSICQLQFAQVIREAGRKHPSITQPSSWRPCLAEHGTLGGRALRQLLKICLLLVLPLSLKTPHFPTPALTWLKAECPLGKLIPFHISGGSLTQKGRYHLRCQGCSATGR